MSFEILTQLMEWSTGT